MVKRHGPARLASSYRALVIYVGKRGQENLRIGLDKGVWGFKVLPVSSGEVRRGDWILIGSGYPGQVRVSYDVWQGHSLGDLYIASASSDVFNDSTPLWPDESGPDRYPYRVRFKVVGHVEDFSLGGLAVASGVSDALRRSAIRRGWGQVITVKGDLLSSLETG